MDRFVARENIRHFRDRLWSESDPDTRARLQKLLVEEEDKLAADLEKLDDLDRHIADGNRRIEWQQVLVETLERDGRDGIKRARDLLDGLIETQQLHTEYRERILIKIDRNRI